MSIQDLLATPGDNNYLNVIQNIQLQKRFLVFMGAFSINGAFSFRSHILNQLLFKLNYQPDPRLPARISFWMDNFFDIDCLSALNLLLSLFSFSLLKGIMSHILYFIEAITVAVLIPLFRFVLRELNSCVCCSLADPSLGVLTNMGEEVTVATSWVWAPYVACDERGLLYCWN